MNIKELKEEGYKGFSVRSLLADKAFRKKVLEDPAVRGNSKAKNEVMDKLAVSGKVLIIGPTGEAKTLFGRVLLSHLIKEVNNRKYHIKNCPFNEDAGYIIKTIEHFEENPFQGINVIQSLCPFCRNTIEKNIEQVTGKKISVHETEKILKIKKDALVDALNNVEVEKTIINKVQLDPRNDPESLYMLLAGVENLEILFSSKAETTFTPATHKVGVLSQGFVLVNEIQRLPLTLLESLMGFLEDPSGIKYNIAGETVYIDGAMIFTSNAPLTAFGEETQPILNRIPQVLWPARDYGSRLQIVRDMFKEHLILSRNEIPPNPEIVNLIGLKGPRKDYVSRLAMEFIANLADKSMPTVLKTNEQGDLLSNTPDEFYKGLDEIHDPTRSRLIDLRTLYSMIGELVINAIKNESDGLNLITMDDVRRILGHYTLSSRLVDEVMSEIRNNLKRTLKSEKLGFDLDKISEDVAKMKKISDDILESLIIEYEGIQSLDDTLKNEIVANLKDSYQTALISDII